METTTTQTTHTCITAPVKDWIETVEAVRPGVITGRKAFAGSELIEITFPGGRPVLHSNCFDIAAQRELTAEPVQMTNPASTVFVNYSWMLKMLKILPRKKYTAATLTDDGATVALQSGGYSLPSKAVTTAEFPEFPPRPTGPLAEADRREFVEAANRTIVAASSDCTLPVLEAMEVKAAHHGLTLAATDRYRAATDFASASNADQLTVNIPANVWANAHKHLTGNTLTIASHEGLVYLESSGTRYVMRMPVSEFPKIRSLYPQRENITTAFTTETKSLTDELEITKAITGKDQPVRLAISPTGLQILPTVDSPEAQAKTSAPDIEADWTTTPPAETGTVGIHPQFLSDVLITG